MNQRTPPHTQSVRAFFACFHTFPRALFPLFFIVWGMVLSCAFSPGYVWASGGKPSEYPVGMETFGVWNEVVGERFDFAVWYPALTVGSPHIFEGWHVEAARKTRIAPGFFPVVLLSHDAASGRFANNDMAISIAASGVVVIVPTHTGDSQDDSSLLYTAEIVYKRPRQMLRALEVVLDSPSFGPHVDESRIGLLGVGFGSISVLQLAGARPDFTRYVDYCSTRDSDDPFCSDWAQDRFSRIAEDMIALETTREADVFTPSLAALMPKFMAVPIPEPEPEKEEPEEDPVKRPSFWQWLTGKKPEESVPVQGALPPARPSFWQWLFGDEKDTAPPLGPEELLAAAQNALGQSAVLSPEADVFANLEFQGGEYFGGTDSGAKFVYFSLNETFTPIVTQKPPTRKKEQKLTPERIYAQQAHRRPDVGRRLMGIALVAPAGGMFFSRESLNSVHVPAAMIEVEEKGFYPPRKHSQPYFSGFPARPEVLNLSKVDHYSLFARCSKDMMIDLGEACGRLVGKQRQLVADERDVFITSFFHSVLGGALPPAEPTGFVSVPQIEKLITNSTEAATAAPSVEPGGKR